MPRQPRLDAAWYGVAPPLALRPLAAAYGAIARARRAQLQPRAQKLSVPVVVVGNISVGGTGKTPLVIWLVERLREWGWRPGVISRGYGGRATTYPLRVMGDTPAALAGDEPVVIARRAACPVAVAPDRVAAARMLIDSGEIDILIADDGLQHYALARDLEICVVDGVRGLGNGALLPAGPLREPPSRLSEVNLVVVNGGDWVCEYPSVRLQLALSDARPLSGGAPRALTSFAQARVHALAGIGNPARFFDALRAQRLAPMEHSFPDHHVYLASELEFGDALPVLMTEKDAVKCAGFAQPHHWYVPVAAQLDAAAIALVRNLIDTVRPR